MKMGRAILIALSVTFLVAIFALLSWTTQTQSNGVVTGTRSAVKLADPRPKVAQMKEKSSGSRRQSQYDEESAGDDHRGRGEVMPSTNIEKRIENDENDFGDSDGDSTKEKTGLALRKSKTNKNKHGAAGISAIMRDKSNWVKGNINGSLGQYLLQRLNSNTAVDQSAMKGKSKVTTDEGMIKEQSYSMSVSETREESSSDSYEANDDSEVSSGSDKEQKPVFGKKNKKSQKNIPKLQSIWKITVR